MLGFIIATVTIAAISITLILTTDTKPADSVEGTQNPATAEDRKKTKAISSKIKDELDKLNN